jgi:hypothetical protein
MTDSTTRRKSSGRKKETGKAIELDGASGELVAESLDEIAETVKVLYGRVRQTHEAALIARLRLGRYLAKVSPPETVSVGRGHVNETMREIQERTGIGHSTLETYRAVGAAFPEGSTINLNPEVTWGLYRALVHEPEPVRHELIQRFSKPYEYQIWRTDQDELEEQQEWRKQHWVHNPDKAQSVAGAEFGDFIYEQQSNGYVWARGRWVLDLSEDEEGTGDPLTEDDAGSHENSEPTSESPDQIGDAGNVVTLPTRSEPATATTASSGELVECPRCHGTGRIPRGEGRE